MLPLPKVLTGYLLYSGHKYATLEMKCSKVKDSEIILNRYLDELDSEGLIPRSFHGVGRQS